MFATTNYSSRVRNSRLFFKKDSEGLRELCPGYMTISTLNKMLEKVERALETRQKIEVTVVVSTLTLFYTLLTHYLDKSLFDELSSSSV